MNTFKNILTSTRESLQSQMKIASSYKLKENSFVFYGKNSDEKEFSMIVTLSESHASIAINVQIHWCETSEEFDGLYVANPEELNGESLTTLLYYTLNN